MKALLNHFANNQDNLSLNIAAAANNKLLFVKENKSQALLENGLAFAAMLIFLFVSMQNMFA